VNHTSITQHTAKPHIPTGPAVEIVIENFSVSLCPTTTAAARPDNAGRILFGIRDAREKIPGLGMVNGPSSPGLDFIFGSCLVGSFASCAMLAAAATSLMGYSFKHSLLAGCACAACICVVFWVHEIATRDRGPDGPVFDVETGEQLYLVG
jgi:hypothetical protein